MYNPEQKKEYIDFLVSRNANAGELDFIEDLFNTTEKAEVTAGTDLCDMTAEQIGSLIGKKRRELDADHFRSIWWIYCYVKWCASSGLCRVNEWTESIRNSKDMEIVRQQMVANDFDLQTRLDHMLTDENKMTLDNLVRACAWILYAGVDIDRVCQIRISDVDTKAMTVRVDDTWYDISRYGEASIRFAAEEDSYVRHYLHAELNHGWKIDEDRVIKKNPETDMLFRDSAGPIDLDRMIYIYGKRIGSRYDRNRVPIKTMSFRTISISGIFDRMYKMDLAGHDPFMTADTRQYERLVIEDTGRLNSAYNEKKKKLGMKAMLRENYYKWKLAFLPQINLKD